ncbi:hypothetical protein Poli38472_009356 [Pythium oligandrum]|uniref:Ankyrin repeat protein n=1 Tax=Pythium oligandrum TaxID=41045 RepID=A0A8K1FLE8_PYTOL|nr:hypothetical protein Poli38472_009356 [Pythium oligandrum]|eukprot:TMW65189.1 hypothetical protein Poli38472_009356 [Pythium oligandrum]
MILFDEPAKRHHIHVFEWFLSEEAHGIIGDTMLSLLLFIFKRELGFSQHSMEFTETILDSHLYHSMSPVKRDLALSYMLMAAIESKKPSVVRLLVVHGASLVNPAKKLGCCAVDGDGPTAQMLLDCGVFAVVHHALDLTALQSTTLDVAEVFLKNGMDAQAVNDDSEPLANAAVQGYSAARDLIYCEAKTRMETTVDRSALFDAAARGDLDMIRCYFHQPVAQTPIADVNRLLWTVYTAALEANTTPYTNTLNHIDNAWFRQPGRGRSWHSVMLFEEVVKRGQIHILKWFLGEEAYPIIGDNLRIFWPGLWYSKVTSEVMEMILTSYLYLRMRPANREIALSMMLHSSIGLPSPSAVRHLIAHGASLVDPTEALVCCTFEGNGPARRQEAQQQTWYRSREI